MLLIKSKNIQEKGLSMRISLFNPLKKINTYIIIMNISDVNGDGRINKFLDQL